MNYRVSFILLVLVAIVGGYVVLFQLQSSEEAEPQNPWVYDITFGDITGVKVRHLEDTQTFVKSESGWVFADSGEPVDNDRWGGVPLLLTGPRSSRVLEEVVQDPASFGLDPPLTHIVITLRSGREIDLLIGDKTPDVGGSYVMVGGSPTLFTAPSDWTDVLTRLVIEPPHISESTAEEAA